MTEFDFQVAERADRRKPVSQCGRLGFEVAKAFGFVVLGAVLLAGASTCPAIAWWTRRPPKPSNTSKSGRRR